MKRELTTSEMVNELLNDEYADWSYNGARALIEYLEQMEEDCGMSIEFDRVAIRCEYTEDTLGYFLKYYTLESHKELEENTAVIYVSEPEDWENPSSDTVVIIQDY